MRNRRKESLDRAHLELLDPRLGGPQHLDCIPRARDLSPVDLLQQRAHVDRNQVDQAILERFLLGERATLDDR